MSTTGFSADSPPTLEDRGRQTLRAGQKKRFLGNTKAIHSLLNVEQEIYLTRTVQANRFRQQFACDIVEIYGGFANITAEALRSGLRAVQPVDRVHGIDLTTRQDHERLRQLLLRRRPYLIVWELRCDPWSNIQHLNFNQEELQKLRATQTIPLVEMRKTIFILRDQVGTHFLIENPWGTPFWDHPEIQKIRDIEGAELQKGSMCSFGLRGRNSQLLRKDTGWLSDLPLVLSQVCRPCRGDHEHEVCLGDNARRGQVYTPALAQAVVAGLRQSLQADGDERFNQPADGGPFTWLSGQCHTQDRSEVWAVHCSPPHV